MFPLLENLSHIWSALMSPSQLVAGVAICFFLLLNGCSTYSLKKSETPSATGYDALKYGQSSQPTHFEKEGIPVPFTKSIAVTDISYSKITGEDQKKEYGEIRGVSGSIKGMLIKAGFKVLQGVPNSAVADQNDDYFDINNRIKSGVFEGADYVLYGVLTEQTRNHLSAPITETQNTMAIHTLDVAVDFSLIDTKSLQVVASFVAMGSGSDSRIDGQVEGYEPNQARMMKQVSDSLAENVAYQLGNQDFVMTAGKPLLSESRVIPGTDKTRNDESGLKVYK